MANWIKSLFDFDYKLPTLSSARVVEKDQHIEIGMNSETMVYYIEYPSGFSKEFEKAVELAEELKTWIKDEERIEDMIRYATNWRSTAFFPSTGIQYIKLPDGRVGYPGFGNHKSPTRK
jgi:hypothetical protein